MTDEEATPWVWPARLSIEYALGKPVSVQVEVQKPTIKYLAYRISKAWHKGKLDATSQQAPPEDEGDA